MQNLPTSFHSILFEPSNDERTPITIEPPAYFRDLNLDQIVGAITSGREEYNLLPLYYTRLTNPAQVRYRQAVMLELENHSLFTGIKSFSQQMRSVRMHLAAWQKPTYKYYQQGYFLHAVEIYCRAVLQLCRDLHETGVNSPGLRAFYTYLQQYLHSGDFETLGRHSAQLRTDLSAIKYSLVLGDGWITVRNDDSDIDYGEVIEKTFEKFKQGAAKDYKVKLPDSSGMNHIEAQILDRVAALNPDVFKSLDLFCAKHVDFLDDVIVVFDREIQFYVAFHEYAEVFKRAGLQFCYPDVSATDKHISGRETFDLALAGKLIREGSMVVRNDFSLKGCERICVISGPNQGGKTTFARMFGQLHYLASLGYPVPGAEARIFLCDRLFTHFEKTEDIATLHGKLQDDLIRIHRILQEATGSSIIIMNEIFSSTSVEDGLYLGKKIMQRLSELDVLGVCVTFLDELSRLNEKTVSMVAAIVTENPVLRTYRIERKPADGLAYALAIAEKHRVTYQWLSRRLNP